MYCNRRVDRHVKTTQKGDGDGERRRAGERRRGEGKRRTWTQTSREEGGVLQGEGLAGTSRQNMRQKLSVSTRRRKLPRSCSHKLHNSAPYCTAGVQQQRRRHLRAPTTPVHGKTMRQNRFRQDAGIPVTQHVRLGSHHTRHIRSIQCLEGKRRSRGRSCFFRLFSVACNLNSTGFDVRQRKSPRLATDQIEDSPW